MQAAATAHTCGTDFVEYLSTRHPGARIFTSHRPHAITALILLKDRCRLQFYQEATPDQIGHTFAQAQAEGAVGQIDTVLLDFSGFTGSIDWEYIKRNRDLLPALHRQPKKAAYVVASELAKRMAETMFHWRPNVDCQSFLDVADAEHWLGWR